MRERKRKWIKAKNTSSAISAFKKAQSSRARSMKAQYSKELKFMEPDQNHPDQQHHKKDVAGYLFSLCHKKYVTSCYSLFILLLPLPKSHISS